MTEEQKQQGVPVDSLNPQQILALKKNLEEEMTVLNQSLEQFKIATQRYDETRVVISALEVRTKQNNEVLIPLTNSLYIQGEYDKDQKLLVDYGTGYFVERDRKQTVEYCDRKIKLIKENSDKLVGVLTQKSKQMDQINLVLQKKLTELQLQQQQQQQQQLKK